MSAWSADIRYMRVQQLSDAVGYHQTNASADVALVQAILVLIRRSAKAHLARNFLALNGTYLAKYDGVWGSATHQAISDFQIENLMYPAYFTPIKRASDPITETARASLFSTYFSSARAPKTSFNIPGVIEGTVRPGDATWRKMVDMLPADFVDLRAISGGKTVYLAATQADLQNKIALATAAEFAPTFKPSVINCIKEVHRLHGIAVGVCPAGARRTFAKQYEILLKRDGSTYAGPGESNHNFGMAVDLGFEGLRWLRPDGTVTPNEDSWMHQLDPKQGPNQEALQFWDALWAVGTGPAVKLFPSKLAGDHPHLQNFDDNAVHMPHRLVALLTRFGTMKWSVSGNKYSCDLGLGGTKIPVGMAENIWNQQATITAAQLQTARDEAAKLKAKAKPATPPAAPLPPVTQTDVDEMKKKLRGEFEKAEANWQSWTPA